MPTFRQYVESVFRKQLDELDKDVKTLQHNKRVIKSLLREFKGFSDDQLKGMFKEDDKAVVEYKKMRDQVDEYVNAMNEALKEKES